MGEGTLRVDRERDCDCGGEETPSRPPPNSMLLEFGGGEGAYVCKQSFMPKSLLFLPYFRLWNLGEGNEPLFANSPSCPNRYCSSPIFGCRIWGSGMSLCLKTGLHAQNAIVPPPFSVFENGLLRGDTRFIPPPILVFKNGGGLEGVCGNKTLLAFTRTPHERCPF